EIDDAHAAASDLTEQLVLAGKGLGETAEVVGWDGEGGRHRLYIILEGVVTQVFTCSHGLPSISGQRANEESHVEPVQPVRHRTHRGCGPVPSQSGDMERTWPRRPGLPRRPRTTRFRSTEPTSSNSTSATRNKLRTFTKAHSAFN